MRVWTTHECGVQHARQFQVVDVMAASAQDPLVLDAGNAGANQPQVPAALLRVPVGCALHWFTNSSMPRSAPVAPAPHLPRCSGSPYNDTGSRSTPDGSPPVIVLRVSS